MTSPATPQKPPARWGETLFAAVTRGAGMGVLACVLSLVVVLAYQSWPAFAGAGQNHLLTSAEWRPNPTPVNPDPSYGSLAFVYGTLVTSGIALLLAVPLGVGSAAFLSEIAPRPVRKVGMFLVELLAAIPSVVYGFWGLTVLAPALQRVFDLVGGPNTGGNGILAAGLVLAVMVLPYITAISFDVIRAVPRISREGSLALGASRWQTIWSVVLPTARPGIVAAAFLALGRALGETMAVTMLIGNKSVIQSPLFGSGDTIASKMANSIAEAGDPNTRAAVMSLALILFAVTAVTNVLARLLLTWLTRPKAPAAPPVGEPVPAGELPPPPPGIVPPRSLAALWNRVMTAVLAVGTLVTVVPLFLILGLIVVKGVPAVADPALFTHVAKSHLKDDEFREYQEWRRGERADPPRNSVTGRRLVRGGLGHQMLGSLVMVVGATLLAVPVGLLAAIWLAEARRSPVANVTRAVAELLGGVPSIVIGLFVYAVLCAPTYGNDEPLGASAWAGMVALAVLMLPVVVRSAEESMRLVPSSLREASYALGANRMQTSLRVIVPASLPAIVTGIFLAIGRIAGETAPLLFTAQQNQELPMVAIDEGDPDSPTVLALDESFPFLTGKINEYAQSPYADYKDQAWGGTLVLMGVVMALNVGIRLVAGKRVVAASSGG
ncbi:MAG: phosphate ABC transporter permease subunit PstC [Fimbriiglobus sp.]|jgi:phosphate transport system permease protein|nr:phosphate ABC transporter permease subunit PstC [Fimbriiglobus sp.]